MVEHVLVHKPAAKHILAAQAEPVLTGILTPEDFFFSQQLHHCDPQSAILNEINNKFGPIDELKSPTK